MKTDTEFIAALVGHRHGKDCDRWRVKIGLQGEYQDMQAQVGEWYVIHCKPCHEKQVCCHLTATGYETFFPTYLVQSASLRPPKARPFFPRYLFVRADLAATGISALSWIPGAVGLVKYGDVPAIVPEHIIQHLKERVAEIERAGGLHPYAIKQGERVRVLRGPFAGYEAIFDLRLNGAERVRVLLRMLGRQVKVVISADAIEKSH